MGDRRKVWIFDSRYDWENVIERKGYCVKGICDSGFSGIEDAKF